VVRDINIDILVVRVIAPERLLLTHPKSVRLPVYFSLSYQKCRFSLIEVSILSTLYTLSDAVLSLVSSILDDVTVIHKLKGAFVLCSGLCRDWPQHMLGKIEMKRDINGPGEGQTP
jgi:hypothetical protein